MPDSASPQHFARSRYGLRYWTLIFVLNLVAVFMGRDLGRILFVDGLIVAVFGTAAIAKLVWRRLQPHSN
jgi:hypothetical protein